MNIYLSAPISGHDLSERREYFARMEKAARAKWPKALIFNPMDNPQDWTDAEHYRHDFITLAHWADTIVQDGYTTFSRGCITEANIAACLQLEKHNYNDKGEIE